MRFPILRLQTEHKFVRQLKKFLNELVTPNPNLPLDDIFDARTQKAVRDFQDQWINRVFSASQKGRTDGVLTVATWAMIGRALYKTDPSLILRELREVGNDYELRSLLLGMDEVSRVYKGYYTAEMEACDAKIASIFGGKNAIAAANGFDPDSLAIIKQTRSGLYAAYRGDSYDLKADGSTAILSGHLTGNAMHLYGSTDGTRFGVDGNTYTDLYIPDGFRGSEKPPLHFRRIPGPSQASLDFYYKRLGNYQDVTLMVSHIKDFKLVKEGNRWHIGQIGGKSGDTLNYIHSHFDLFKGDVGMTGPRTRLSFAKAFCP